MIERRKALVERRLAEIRQMEFTTKFEGFIKELPCVHYIVKCDKNGSPIYVSPKIEKLLGFTPEQWCSEPELRIKQLHPDDRDRVLSAVHEALSTTRTLNIEYRIFTRYGEVRWLHEEAVIANDAGNKEAFLQGVIFDITEPKEMRIELEHSHRELQRFINTCDELKEAEQKRLAQEMHDDLGQLLAIIKMDLSVLRQKLPSENYDSLLMQISNISQVVDQMTTSIRRMIANYQPCALEKMGLFQAVGALIADYAKRYQMQYEYHFPQSNTLLDVRIATAIYRIVQEALNNVVKHSEATRVEVRIDCFDNSVTLNVADNGKGMTNPGHDMRQTGSFGVVGMRDRVNALGGRIKFEGKAGTGTSIQVVIPRKALDECK